MKSAIVFSSATENTQKLAEIIRGEVGEICYYGKPSDEALEADVIYVGSWTMAFTATADIKEFLGKLENKKVVLFMTAGYGHTPEFFEPIMNSVKESVNASNEIIGEFICHGKVSASKQEAIKKMDEAKFESMKAELEKSQAHPNAEDIENLKEKLKK